MAWNTKTGRGDQACIADLRNLIADTDPDVLLLQEAAGYCDAIVSTFGVKNGGQWRVYQHRDWPDSNDCPVMVHQRFGPQLDRGTGWSTLRTTTTWTGPQGGDHKGRTWTWVRLGGLYALSFHRCWGASKGRNLDAFREEYEVVRNWMRDRGDPVLVLGDHNCKPKDKDPDTTSWHIADAVDGAVAFDSDEPGVDYGLVLGVSAQSVNRTKAYGSDHRAVVFCRA